MTIPLSCRILRVPLVWVIQSTWLPDFFRHGAGMTDHVRSAPVKWHSPIGSSYDSSTSGSGYGFLNPVNRAAKHFGVPGYDSIFEFWRGDITLVAEPP